LESLSRKGEYGKAGAGPDVNPEIEPERDPKPLRMKDREIARKELTS
jgi:hypothetical protein